MVEMESRGPIASAIRLKAIAESNAPATQSSQNAFQSGLVPVQYSFIITLAYNVWIKRRCAYYAQRPARAFCGRTWMIC